LLHRKVEHYYRKRHARGARVCAAFLGALIILPLAPLVYGDPGAGRRVMVDAGEVKMEVVLANARTSSGQQLGVTADFAIAPGWHIYGKPLPEEYTSTTVVFDDALVAKQQLDFPKPTPVKFEMLGDTLPVYQGHFKAAGDILLRQKLTPGEHQLGGTLSFQECNDNLCKMPQQVHFEIPIRIEPMVPAAPKS